jgi:hypothetical protein
LVKAGSEQEYWVVVFMIRVRQTDCLSVVDEFNNKQTAHCVMTHVKFQQNWV